MEINSLFTLALGLQSPWHVVNLDFKAADKRLDLLVDFSPGSEFPCPECGVLCGVHDAPKREWRHLNFFEHTTSGAYSSTTLTRRVRERTSAGLQR